MIECGLSLRLALNALCSTSDILNIRRFLLTNDEWYLLTQIHLFLKNFKLVSTLLGGDKYATLPLVIVAFNMLLDKIENTIKSLNDKKGRCQTDENLFWAFQAARDKLIKYYDKTNWIYCVVLLLDPRHKLETFNLTNWGKELLCQSLEKFKEIYKESYFESSSNESESSNLNNATFNSDSNLIDINSLYENNSDNNKWHKEIDEYLNSKRTNKDEDILEWWSKHTHIFPCLSKMARDFLSICATSVPSERLFSTAGLIITKRRNRLCEESARSLLCLNSWATCLISKILFSE